MRRCWILVGALLSVAACTPVEVAVPASPATGSPAPATVSTSAAVPPPPTAAVTSSTMPPSSFPDLESVRAFLDAVRGRPDLVEVSEAGYRIWRAERSGAGDAVPFPDDLDGIARLAVGTAAGVVYAGADGGLHLGPASAGTTESDQTVQAPGRGRYLQDVALAGSTPMAITIESESGEGLEVVGSRVAAVDVASGDEIDLYDAGAEVIKGASYGGGTTLVVRDDGGRRSVHLVSGGTDSGPIDILAPGQPDSAVLSPDGTRIFFSTVRNNVRGTSLYTFALGTEGPALDIAIPVAEGRWICNFDTDGRWVSGTINATDSGRITGAFLYDFEAGEAYVTDIPMRLTFVRSDRTFLIPGAAPVLDGRFFGYLKGLRSAGGSATMAIDYAEYLTGESAARAAEAAGDESPPPGGYYIRDTDPTVRRIPVAADADVWVVANFPEAGPDLERITVDQWVRLVNGDASAVDFTWYGSGTLPYWVTIDAGVITSVEEVMLS